MRFRAKDSAIREQNAPGRANHTARITSDFKMGMNKIVISFLFCNPTYVHVKWHYCWLRRSVSKELLRTNTFASVSHTNSFSLFAGLFPEMTTAFVLNAISTTQGPIFFRTFGTEGVTALNAGGTLVLINHASAIVTAHHLIASVWKKRYTGILQIIMSNVNSNAFNRNRCLVARYTTYQGVISQ